MIETLRGLVSKELQQQRAHFFWIVLISALLTWLIGHFMSLSGQVLSHLELTAIFAWPLLAFIALAIGYLLVTQEYYGGTQRFIEALPIRRGYMVSVKYSIGLLAVGLIAFCVWGYSTNVASAHEPIGLRFATIMATRLAAYIFVLWSCVFAFSLLGRWRIPLVGAAIMMVVFVNSQTSLELSRLGPFALIDRELFSAERQQFPRAEIAASVMLGVLALSFAMLLARTRDGSYVESLAVPMSTRDRSFLFVIIVAGIGLIVWFDPATDEQDFAFTDSHVIVRGNLEVAYLEPQFEQDAIALADYLAKPLASLEALIPLGGEPFKTRISLSPVAKPWDFELQLGSRQQGIRVDANFERVPAWNRADFGMHLIHELLATASSSRLLLEPAHWLLDGFAAWWMEHGKQAAPPLEAPATDFFTLAMYAAEINNIDATMLRQWDTSADRLGDTLGLALAYSGWRVLEEVAGRETALRLAKAEFQCPFYGDLRDWWLDWRRPFPRRFESATGMPWPVFVSRWAARIEQVASRTQNASVLAKLPRVEFSATGEVDGSNQRVLNFGLELAEALPTAMSCVALHRKLPAYNISVARGSLRESEFSWPAGQTRMEYNVTGEYGSDNRIYAAVECHLMPFNVPVRFGVAQLTMP